jgi:YVTN family beta-propeller protein
MRPRMLGWLVPSIFLSLLLVSSVPASAGLGSPPAKWWSGDLFPQLTTAAATPSPPGALLSSPSPLSRWIPTATAYTFDPFNDSLVQGEFNPPSPGYPTAAIDIPSTGNFVVGDSAGNYAYELNASTGREVRAIDLGPPTLQFVGSDPIGFGYNPSNGLLYVALLGDSSIAYINLTTGEVVRSISVPGYPDGLVYDEENGLLYATNDTGVFALNGTTGVATGFLPLTAGVTPIILDPLTGDLLVGNGVSSIIYVVNTSDFQVDTHFSTVVSGAGYGPDALLYDTDTKEVYSADGDGNISVFDARTYKLNVTKPEIEVGGYPNSLAFNPLRQQVLVSSCQAFGYRVCAIEDSNNTLDNSTLPNAWPGYVAYDPGSEHLLVYNNNDTAYLFNATDDQEISLTSMITSYLGAALDPSNGLEYVATPALGGICTLPGSVSIFEPGSHPALVGSLPAGDGPSQVTFDATNNRAFITDFCSNSLTVVDTSNDSLVRLSLPVGSAPYGIADDPDSNFIFVANEYSQNLTVLNGSTLAVAASIHLPLSDPYGVVFDPANDSILVSDIDDGVVTIVNATTFSVSVPALPVGANPQGMLYDPQNGVIYVSNTGSNNLSLLNATTYGSVGSITLVGGPSVLALDPIDHLVFSADVDGSRVSVINAATETAENPSLPASADPEGIVFASASQQVDVFNFGAGAINILANAPTPSTLTATPASTEIGSSTTLSLTLTNGTPPYSFNWTGLPRGCTPASSPALVCIPASAGAFEVSVTTDDAAGYTWSTTVSVTVLQRLGSETLVAEPATLDLGMSTTIEWNTSGGVPPFTYKYTGLPSGCYSVNASAVNCTPLFAGSYSVVSTDTDALGVVAFANVGLIVNSLPEVTAFVADSYNPIVNTSVLLAATVVGGSPPLAFSYTGLPPGCVTADVLLLECVPLAPGNYTLTFTVTDSLGRISHSSLFITVLPAPTVRTPPPEIVAFFASPSSLSLGSNTTFYVVIEGGASPYSLSWAGLPQGCSPISSTATALMCTPTHSGSYSVRVNVTDGLGRSVDGGTSLYIGPANIGASSSAQGVSESTLLDVSLGAAALGGLIGAATVAFVLRRPPKPPMTERSGT